MANYWAIAIGINQYQLFQPLSYAQADAEALGDLLVTEAGFVREHCLLMTDTSPPRANRSTYPTKENILLLLEDLAATSFHPQDYLWLFFSGYGVNYNGKDYLIPVEGNPELVLETGIEVRSLMQSLQLADLNVLLLLDINRAFGTQADAPVGEEIIELAQELQIATILSCQPEQFSHENSELGHGFFTAALLEALRSGNGSSLTDLESYLSLITPQLCQHHWRPIQNPAVIIPSRQQVILPQLAVESDLETDPIIYPEESFAIARAAPPLDDNPPKTSADQDRWEEVRTVETTVSPSSQQKAKDDNSDREVVIESVSEPVGKFPDQNLMPETSLDVNTNGRFLPSLQSSHQEESTHLTDSSYPAYVSRLPPNQTNTPALWKQFILWGGGSMVVAGLIAVVFLRNQATFRIKQISIASPNAETSDPTFQDSPNDRSITEVAPPGQSRNRSRAQIASNSESKNRNQAVLDLRKMSLRPTQASDLSLAIATARKIQPGEPLYQQAQENIKIWSRMILELAEGRAKQRRYANAIATAQLITKDEALYAKAQAAINQWRIESKEYVSNKTLLDAANALINPGQASTYNRAIEVAKRVPSGQPGFDTAQKSINKWSEKILDLAKSRAAQGELNAAIKTAALVPEVTAAYEDAQDAIQKWQDRRIRN
ncbi:caspase family protein [aff. Roholtiella sp. LEGE 12411]|uniref:caspase family protein n=1 Tax=aff. Roholtiella sp. LEGE 12411 TaxID=1828822 RepID=UPI0018830144|nr:caspase family protein [aff. Roholtiella sp. LEGE 12411]MBE9034582.1 caspase family protein [aff. Roholtiella sp. LEGE 12411]